MSRTASSARNVSIGVLSQVLIILLGFATRTVFVAQLGVVMLGVNSLLTSTVAMLALADLGINGAVMYALYKPLKEGDTDRVAAIVEYARRLFRWVALTVAVVGISGTPFIHKLIRLDGSVPHFEVYYLVLLGNTVAGYLMMNRMVLLNADQKIYITKTYSMVFNTIRSVLQIILLVAFQDFLAYLIIQVVCTVANNGVVYLQAGKIYPFVHAKSPTLPSADRKVIRESVRALMIFRVGRLVLLNAPPVLISTLVGTETLGYYANYMLIVSSAVMITDIVFNSLTPSLGNLLAAGDGRSGRHVFDEIILVAVLLHGAIAVGIFVLTDDFIRLWLGPEFVLPPMAVVAIAFNFYVTGMLMPIWSFRNDTGLYRKTQWVMLGTAVLSLVLSVALGRVFGLPGVIVSPGVAWLLTGGWYEPWLLLRDHLVGRARHYFAFHAKAVLLWVFTAGSVWGIRHYVPLGETGSFLLVVGLLGSLLPAGIWVVFGRSSAFNAARTRFEKLARGLTGKPRQ